SAREPGDGSDRGAPAAIAHRVDRDVRRACLQPSHLGPEQCACLSRRAVCDRGARPPRLRRAVFPSSHRFARPLISKGPGLLATGIAFAVFYLTREDREWIYPSVLIILGYWTFARAALWRRRQPIESAWRRALEEASALAIPILAFLAILGAVD